jgi:hypothetical protein
LSEDGNPVRASWPLPAELVDQHTHEEFSTSGCSKKRFGIIGHRQRSGLWILVCMRHESIIGFHIMPVQKANETCCIPCTNTRRTHQSRFGSTSVVGAMRWR